MPARDQSDLDLPVQTPVPPMLAKLVRELPRGPGLIYEPKWDGFRCIVLRDGDRLELTSRNERPLTRYFPELVSALKARLPVRCVVDGEIVILGPRGLDFDALLQRIHPAPSRIERLARETPASFVAFDLLALGERSYMDAPFVTRREALLAALGSPRPPLYVTPATRDSAVAASWLADFEGAGLDGVVAKPGELPYVPGKREMLKVKHARTADCVVGGYRPHKRGEGVGSLLLGLYDAHGVLHHVGVATGFSAAQRRELQMTLRPLERDALANHPWAAWRDAQAHPQRRMPGGPSRWTGTRELSWLPVRPEKVAEVAYDHLQGERFRHATRFVRWRPDRDPASCRYDQLETVPPETLRRVFGAMPGSAGQHARP